MSIDLGIFNKGNLHLTFGEVLRPLSDIETKEEAEEYFDTVVDYIVRANRQEINEARRIAYANMRYWANNLGTISCEVMKWIDMYKGGD